VLERALAWAAQGWPVFPCNEDGTPAVKGWQQEATTDPDKIRGWFWDGRVACVPGLAGCFVIDVDVKNGKDGEASLARLEAEHDFEAWNYPQQETPSGGRHLFLRGEAPSSVQSLFGEGLDTRGGTSAGGLGFIYAYGDDPPCDAVSCPPGPESFRRLLEKTDRRISEERETPRVELDQPANIERALSFVRNLPSPGEGERNHTVFKTVCTMKDLGLSMAKVFEILEDHPSVTGTPPLCEENVEEFNATVRSAYKNGQLQPGIHAIDEEERNKAAEGFHVAEAEGQDASRGVAGNRRRFTRWAEERDRPPPPWLIRGILPKVALAGMYAPGGHYKSFIGLDMLLAIASGASEWGGQKISDPGAPVVYVAGEGSAAPRIRAWETVRGLSGNVGDNFVTYHGLDIMDDGQLAGFRDDLESLHKLWGRGPAIIGFDTLARAAPGQDENSAKDMGLFVQKVDALKAWANTCILLVHHTPKASNEWRGSSAVWNALDVGLEVRKKGTNHATLRLSRTKDGPEGKAWKIALKGVETGKAIDGEAETSLVVEHIEPATKTDSTANAEAVRIENQARMRDISVNELRAEIATAILEATAPEYEIGYGELLNQMQAGNPKANRSATSEWLRSVVRKGEVQADHPLAKFVCSFKPLTFRRVEG